VQDIVTRIDDTAITRGADLRRVLRDLRPGAPVTLSVLRPSGAVSVRATLAEAPDSR
jgi:S1-C subfamily serine protease